MDVDKLIKFIDASSTSSRRARDKEDESVSEILQRKIHPHMGIDVYQTFCRSDLYDSGWIDDESFRFAT